MLAHLHLTLRLSASALGRPCSCSSVGTAYVAMGIAAASLFSYSTANWLLKRRAAPGALLPEGPTSSRAVAGAGACGGKAGAGQQAAAAPGDAAPASDSDAEQEKGDAVPPLPGTALSTDMSSAFAGTGSRDLHAIEHGGSFRRRTSRVIPVAAPEGGATATRAASRMHSVPLDQNGSAVVAEGADHGKQQQQQQQRTLRWVGSPHRMPVSFHAELRSGSQRLLPGACPLFAAPAGVRQTTGTPCCPAGSGWRRSRGRYRPGLRRWHLRGG